MDSVPIVLPPVFDTSDINETLLIERIPFDG
jgi:hypothetical protein